MRDPVQPPRTVYIQPHWLGREPVYETPEKLYKHMVGPGWQKLLLETTEKLFFLGWTGSLSDVKEKFGTLRFYFNNDCRGLAAAIADDVVSHAEDYSGQICEECGKFGRTRNGGWVKTLCVEHAIKQKRTIHKWEVTNAVKDGLLSEEDGKTYPVILEGADEF